MKARKKIIPGSSSAGKTIAILIILIDRCIKEPWLEISVISESVPHLKKGALKDFLKIMRETGRFIEANYNATDRKYTFVNGSYMEFFSPESVVGSRRNVLYINEANFIDYQDYVQMAIRTSGDIYLDFNPAAEFWAHTEVANEPNAEMLTLTYRDNEARPANVDEEFGIARHKADAEKSAGLPITSYWQNFCRVYLDGLTGNVQGIIFNNWQQIPEVPKEAKLVAYGLDFGFTNDPSACGGMYMQDGCLIIDEIFYSTGMLNSDIISALRSAGISREEIIADSAEPKSIEEIRRAGFNIKPAIKGSDSVKASIDRLQQYPIKVTARSVNLIKELRNYKWKVDATGKAMNEPVDNMNHLIDGAMRYPALNCLGKQTRMRAY